MNNKNFIQWLKEPVEGVEPISIIAGLGIGIVCTLVDALIPFVLIIAAFIFIKKGHKAMGAFLVALNFLPDDLPCIDEVIGLIINIVPLWKEYKNVMMTISKAADVIPQSLPDNQSTSANDDLKISNHK